MEVNIVVKGDVLVEGREADDSNQVSTHGQQEYGNVKGKH